MSDISKLVLKKLVSDPIFCKKALPYIKAEYFDGHLRVVYLLFREYVSEYYKVPERVSLEYEFANSKYNVEANASIPSVIESVYNIRDDERNVPDEWMLKKTEEWCRERAIYIGIMKSIEIIDGKDKQLERGSIPDILQRALGVSFDSNIGHDYIENAKERYKFYTNQEERIPFDLEMMNKITKGGVPKKTLNILLAACVHPDTPVKIRIRKKA